jgi:serine protease DegS/serine protease DegQ
VSGAAVISVPATGLTVIPADSTADLKAGALSVVVSASSESGGHFQASIGLFSGVNQAVDLGSGSSMMDAIVTDAAPANPMGAVLLDDQGNVVGILRSVSTNKGATSAVATPIALSQEAATSLLAGQEVVHAWLGVLGKTAPSTKGPSTKGGTRGALVAQVTPASPAALAGIRPGDLVTAIDDQAVPSMAALAEDVESLQPGSSVILNVRRGGATRVLSATLEGQPGLGS